MDVTLKNGKQFIITLRAWDGANWLPDCAGAAGKIQTRVTKN